MTFNLSEKEDGDYYDDGVYWRKDVKEFIRRLKEEMVLSWENNEIINRLAGEKLT